MLESTSSTSSTKDQEHSNLSETANMREILHGISNIQPTLANFMIRLDAQGNHMEEQTKEIRGRNGIQVRLEEVSEQANDTIYTLTELKATQDKMTREISMLKDYVFLLVSLHIFFSGKHTLYHYSLYYYSVVEYIRFAQYQTREQVGE